MNNHCKNCHNIIELHIPGFIEDVLYCMNQLYVSPQDMIEFEPMTNLEYLEYKYERQQETM